LNFQAGETQTGTDTAPSTEIDAKQQKQMYNYNIQYFKVQKIIKLTIVINTTSLKKHLEMEAKETDMTQV
jgi:hypothetical protein